MSNSTVSVTIPTNGTTAARVVSGLKSANRTLYLSAALVGSNKVIVTRTGTDDIVAVWTGAGGNPQALVLNDSAPSYTVGQTGTQVLSFEVSGETFEGTVAPAAPSEGIQFNDGGVFGSDSAFLYHDRGMIPQMIAVGGQSTYLAATQPQGYGMQIAADGVEAVFELAGYCGATHGGRRGGVFVGYGFRGTFGTPAVPNANDVLAGFHGSGYGTTGPTDPRGGMTLAAGETWSPGANGTYMVLSTTPIGGVAPAERVRVTPAGAVGIGTPTPDQVLSVVGDASKTGGGVWAAISDARLKDIHSRDIPGLSAILRLSPVFYSYREGTPENDEDGGRIRMGVIAQEIREVIPSTVRISKERKAEDGTPILMVDASDVLWVLVEAVKELAGELNDLRARQWSGNGGGGTGPAREPSEEREASEEPPAPRRHPSAPRAPMAHTRLGLEAISAATVPGGGSAPRHPDAPRAPMVHTRLGLEPVVGGAGSTPKLDR